MPCSSTKLIPFGLGSGCYWHPLDNQYWVVHPSPAARSCGSQIPPSQKYLSPFARVTHIWPHWTAQQQEGNDWLTGCRRWAPLPPCEPLWYGSCPGIPMGTGEAVSSGDQSLLNFSPAPHSDRFSSSWKHLLIKSQSTRGHTYRFCSWKTLFRTTSNYLSHRHWELYLVLFFFFPIFPQICDCGLFTCFYLSHIC